MADFKQAQEVLEKFEGGYVHDPLDNGGETINGIARKFFPQFKGWEKVDEYKKQFKGNTQGLKAALKQDKVLHEQVSSFYKSNFWDKMKLDSITSQVIATKIYLFGVNAGISKAVKFAQKIAGSKEDGSIGKNSIEALNNLDENKFKLAYKELEKGHYQDIVKKKPNQERFLKGWLARVEALG